MYIVGIDEVGRGCWAGPLVAGAVVLGKPIAGLADSKVLTKSRRKILDIKIKENALAWALGWVTSNEVDDIGLTEAVRLAMKRALENIRIDYEEIIIDGNINYLDYIENSSALIKADQIIPAVSAASIIAKVARDNFMVDIDKEYPMYGFKNHVGYGTKEHIQNLKLYGITNLHRQSYKPIKAFI
jgi:ribonuclease HII